MRTTAYNDNGTEMTEQQRMVIEADENPYSTTNQDLRNRLHMQDVGTIRPQLYAGLIACLSAITFGSCLGRSSPVITQMKEQHIDFTWYPSLVALGAAIGVIPWSYAMETFGPKKVLIVQAPFYIVCWILSGIPMTSSADLQSAVRFFKGLLGMCHRICGETLLVETVHHALVCKMYVLFQSSIYLGVSVTQLIGFNLRYEYTTAICVLVPLTHVIMLLFVPESPVYLMRHNELLAERSLAWYRGPHCIYDDMRLIRRDAEVFRLDVETHRFMIYSKVVMKALLIIFAVNMFRLLTGYYIFLMYSGGHILFGGMVVHPGVLLRVMAATFYLSNVTTVTIHVKYELPVRPPLICSCFGASISLLGTAIGIHFGKTFYTYAMWVPPFFELTLIVCTDIGLNYMPKVMLIEYMPIQVYKMAERYNSVLHWLGAFILLRSFESVRVAKRLEVFFLFLSAFCFIGGVFCYLFVVESKGKSLMRVQLDIGGNPVGNRAAHLKRYQLPKRPKQSNIIVS